MSEPQTLYLTERQHRELCDNVLRAHGYGAFVHLPLLREMLLRWLAIKLRLA